MSFAGEERDPIHYAWADRHDDLLCFMWYAALPTIVVSVIVTFGLWVFGCL